VRRRIRILKSSLTETQKNKVCDLIANMPGLKSREIALRNALNRTELNRFLWGEGKESRGLYERNWRWYHSGVETKSLFSANSRGKESQGLQAGGAQGAPASQQDQGRPGGLPLSASIPLAIAAIAIAIKLINTLAR